MRIFDRFKKKKQKANESENSKGKSINEWKIIMVDHVYLLDVPNDWKEFKSDRFRMKNPSETLQFSATNYGKSLSDLNSFGIEDLTNEVNALFVRFEKEGDYEPINDKIITNEYVYQAFKVDEETQYYFYTYREALGKLIRINFIIRETKNYNISTKNTMLRIGDSIKIKIA